MEGWCEREELEKRHSFSLSPATIPRPILLSRHKGKVTASAGQFFVVNLEIIIIWRLVLWGLKYVVDRLQNSPYSCVVQERASSQTKGLERG